MSEQLPSSRKLEGDRALSAADLDRLGFDSAASKIASSIAATAGGDGLVVGIEGEWGSGKSSLAALVVKYLRDQSGGGAPEVVEFQPWLVKDRDALLEALLDELIAAVDSIEANAGNATGKSSRQIERASWALRRFASGFGGLGKAVRFAGVAHPWLLWIGLTIEWLASLGKKGQRSITKLKQSAVSKLRTIERSIVVVVDDLDRLEPSEIAEVLRLVRAVADFPRVTYLLCYDPAVVGHALQKVADVKDGTAYLRKIIQVAQRVPIPEVFALRRWFRDGLAGLQLDLGVEEEQRLTTVIDVDGGRYLNQPRDVVRTLDALRFALPALRGKVDLPDLIWLTLVKLGNPKLHAWVERYLASLAAWASGRTSISEEGKASMRKRLDAALKAEKTTLKASANWLPDIVPGISSWSQPGDAKSGVFDLDRSEFEPYIRGRRLGSPDHWRLYFAYDQPLNTPTVEDLTKFIALAPHSTAEASELLSSWHTLKLTSGLSKAEALLDRISIKGLLEIRGEQARGALTVFANVLDVIAQDEGWDFIGPEIWRSAMRAFGPLLEATDDRQSALNEMFASGSAIGWLTEVLRMETLANGLAGLTARGDAVLQRSEVEFIASVMVLRFRRMTYENLMGLPKPISTLFAWFQAGDAEGPRQLMDDVIKTDEGLLEFLERVSVKAPPKRERTSLSRSNLGALVDYDAVHQRLQEMTSIPEQTTRAQLLLRVMSESFGA